MTKTDELKAPELCEGCGEEATTTCYVDCGMSLCGAPICNNYHHVDAQLGWRHEARATQEGK